MHTRDNLIDSKIKIIIIFVLICHENWTNYIGFSKQNKIYYDSDFYSLSKESKVIITI